MELLIVLGHLLLFNHKVEFLHDWAEIGWSIELWILESFHVILFDFFQAIDSWIEDVTVEGETVRSLRLRRNHGTKAVKIYHLVGIVVLQDTTYTLNGAKILVSIVKIVKWVRLSWISIWSREIDGHSESQLATAEYVFNERVLLFDLQLIKLDTAIFALEIE